MALMDSDNRAGTLLREWRVRRRMSQLDLSLEAGVSTRHLSYVETGRSRPSADMVLHLAEQLDVPLRERNQLLLAAGHAPVFSQYDVDSPELEAARAALQAVLDAHEPFPALAVDRHWGMVAANRAIQGLIAGVAPELLEEPVNVLRLSLHPDGLAPRIVNLGEWREHLLSRLAREATTLGDPALAALHAELSALPGPPPPPEAALPALAVPLRLRAGDAELVFLSTVTTFGTATDVTLAELSVEAFLPADAATAAALHAHTPGCGSA
ncbi:MAG: hypothetical protein QOF76_1908 [Solirubrobacteraceae bacterium]|jgi:transcriptional regulator with XRE-family HTH domain|nr:hypothetical protein [Solirubrobacteraceae bacterium]